MILLIVAANLIGGPAAIAQTTGAPNSGAGVPGMPGNKSGPVINGKNPDEQSSGIKQDTSKIPGLPGNKSGPQAEKPSNSQQQRP
jgi:hypothetical protein